MFGNKNWSTNATGSTNAYFKVRNWSLQSGRDFADTELHSGKAVCVIGETVRKELFGSDDPVGNKIRLGKVSCQVVGLLTTKGQSNMGQDQDDLIVLPLRTVQRRLAGNQDVKLIQVSMKDGASTETAKEEITELLRRRRHISALEDDNFHVMVV